MFEFLDGEIRTMGNKGTKYPADLYCVPNVSRTYNGLACAFKAKTNTDYFKNLVKDFK